MHDTNSSRRTAKSFLMIVLSIVVMFGTYYLAKSFLGEPLAIVLCGVMFGLSMAAADFIEARLSQRPARLKWIAFEIIFWPLAGFFPAATSETWFVLGLVIWSGWAAVVGLATWILIRRRQRNPSKPGDLP